MAEACRRYLDQGFTAIKFGWGVFGQDPALDVQSHTQLRNTVDAFHLTVQLNIQVDGLLYFSRRSECVARCLL